MILDIHHEFNHFLHTGIALLEQLGAAKSDGCAGELSHLLMG